MFMKALAQVLIWAIVLVMPMGQLPDPPPDYRCIANPAAQVIAAQASNPRGGQFCSGTKAAGGVFAHTVVGIIKGEDADTAVLRRAMEVMPIKDRENVDNRKGGGTMPENAGGFFQMLLKGNRDLFIYLIPTDQNDVYEIAGDYAGFNGEQMRAVSGIYYDAVTSQIYTGNQKGIYGTSYAFRLDDVLVSTENNAFQRVFGFTPLYDWIGGPLGGFDIDTMRIRFPYGGKDWLFQAWKGCYTDISNGAEIGIYEKSQSRRVEFYDCSALELPMSLELYHSGAPLFRREARTWWLGAFQPSPKMKPGNMTLVTGITFDDAGMQAAFVEALSKLKLEYTEKGETVRFTW